MRLAAKYGIVASFSVVALVYLAFYFDLSSTYDRHRRSGHRFPTRSESVRHLWITFTKVSINGGLLYKLESLLETMLVHSRGVPLHLNIITDADSQSTALFAITKLVSLYRAGGLESEAVKWNFYDVNWCADQIRSIIDCMTAHFSPKPGSYYSDALFYLSLGLHHIVPADQHKIVILDCDMRFMANIDLLFEEFNRFKSSNLFGLGLELSSVYRHVLYNYRSKNPYTRFGSQLNFQTKPKNSNNESDNEVPQKEIKSNDNSLGFPGYNSGVILLNLERIRQSKFYESLLKCDGIFNLTQKYSFKGHLGDQDFFTLLGYEHPELFHTLDCGWNRQLCKWWRRYENVAIFDDYFKCDSAVKIYHGNCNTPIPTQ